MSLQFVAGTQRRFYSQDFDSEQEMGRSASKTYARHLNSRKKKKESAGRSFRNVERYGSVQHALEAGLKPKRAMRKSEKMKPKKFTGKVAMYFANTSNAPVPVITEENLEQMPKPNTIKTVKSVRVTSDDLGTGSTAPLVDFITESQKTMSPVAIQRKVDQMKKEGLKISRKLEKFDEQVEEYEETGEMQKVGKRSSKSGKMGFELEQKKEDDMDDFFEEEEEYMDEDKEGIVEGDDKDAFFEGEEEEGESIAPRRISPDEDLDDMTPATREAVLKVRKFFQGTLQWYQPAPGELAEFVATKKQKRETIPSQRTALTSATATSTRLILSGTKTSSDSVVDSSSLMASMGGKRSQKTKSKNQPKTFFDYNQVMQLASKEYEKAKRLGKETDSPLRTVAELPQICVMGRSNVGKSSLLNALMGPNFHKLRVSKTPGRTQTIQMLVVGDKMVVADTPGYGYAAASPQARREMEQRIGEYLTSKLPRRVYILVDSRRGLGNADIRLADSLEQLHIVYQIVLTKVDKKIPAEQKATIERDLKHWVSRRPCAMNEIIKTSSKEKDGVDQLRFSIYCAGGFNL